MGYTSVLLWFRGLKGRRSSLALPQAQTRSPNLKTLDAQLKGPL